MSYSYRPGKRRDNAPKEKLGVMYVRVSTHEQELEGFSIPAQKRLLQEYAEKNGIRVVEIFAEAETAKKAGRKQFERMLAYLGDTPEVTHVLTEKIDRLYRNFDDHVDLMRRNPDANVHFVKQCKIICKDSSSHDWLMHNIGLAIATHYSQNLREEVIKGMQEKARGGDFPVGAPAGYLNDRNERKIVLDPERAPIIRKAFELYATGQYSLADIRKSMILMGYRVRGSGAKPSKSTIEHILKNPFYHGEFRWRGVLYLGKHTPLISRDLFDKVQRLLSRGKPGAYQERKFHFVKFLTCKHCGCAITAEIHKGKYIYYRCTSGRGKCQQKYVPEPKLVAQLGQLLLNLRMEDGFVSWVEAALRERDEATVEAREAEARRLRQDIDRLKLRLDQMYVDKLEGTISEAFWRAKSGEWSAQLEEAERQLTGLEPGGEDYRQKAMRTLELAQSAHSLFLRQPPEEQREILQHVLSNCFLRDGKVEPEYRKPFELLAFAAREFKNEKADLRSEDPKSAEKWAQLDSNQ